MEEVENRSLPKPLGIGGKKPNIQNNPKMQQQTLCKRQGHGTGHSCVVPIGLLVFMLPLGLPQGQGSVGLPMGFGTAWLWGAPALLHPRGEAITHRHGGGSRWGKRCFYASMQQDAEFAAPYPTWGGFGVRRALSASLGLAVGLIWGGGVVHQALGICCVWSGERSSP